jgi:hypothetical protein
MKIVPGGWERVLSRNFAVGYCPWLASPRLASPHLASPRLTSPRLASPHLSSPHRTSPRQPYSNVTSRHCARIVPVAVATDTFITSRVLPKFRCRLAPFFFPGNNNNYAYARISMPIGANSALSSFISLFFFSSCSLFSFLLRFVALQMLVKDPA